MKKSYLFKLLVFAVIAAFVTFTSCKDYDDDISNLENQIAGLSTTLNELKGKVDAGAVITSVTSTPDGLTVVTDKGTYNLTNGKDGANGTNGADGAPGTVWTQHESGFWYKDGAATENRWKPEEAAAGNAVTYEPGEDGFFYKVEGDVKTKTDMQWKQEGGITAVVEANGDVTFEGVKAGENKTTFTIYNNRVLRSLVLIPDYYVNGIEAINFASLKYYSECLEGEVATINPKVLVKYHVNPSSITEDMIKTGEGDITFDYQLKENRVRSAEIAPTAKFVSLKDGILTVEVEIDVTKAENNEESGPMALGYTWYWYIEQLDMIALQVQLSDKALNNVPSAQAVVTSDYGRVDVEDLIDPLIDRKDNQEDGIAYSWQYQDLDAAKNSMEDPYLIEVQYDKQVDLVDYLESLAYSIGADDFYKLDMDKYGLKYKFDLIDTETGDPIEFVLSQNETDQQEFIDVLDADKGTIKSKTYGSEGTAAIGRTPIVRVQLIDTQNDCAITYGYIKIKFVREIVDVVEKEYKETVNFNCDQTSIGPKEEWFNTQIYNVFKLSSAQFHNNYYLDINGVYDAAGKLVDELGTVVEKPDWWPSGQVTPLFAWTVAPDAINDSQTKVLTGYVYYRDRTDDKVAAKIKVTVTVKMPQLSVYGHNLTYWQNSSYQLFKVNPMIYGFAGTPTVTGSNPTANIRTNLLNGFVDKDSKFTSDEKLIIKSSVSGFVPANVAFVFDEAKLANYKYYIGTTEYSVAKNNLKLSADKQTLLFVVGGLDVVAATIQKNALGEYVIALDEDGTEAAVVGSSSPTDPAIALVGQKVPVKISADLCGDEVNVTDVKTYEVTFIEPIKIDAKLAGSFTDAVINGSRIKTADALTFTDWNGYVVRETAFTGEDLEDEKKKYAAELFGYYQIGTAVWDTDNAKTNLKADAGGNLVPTAGVENGALPANYVLSYDAGEGELVFENNGGSPINPTTPEFTLYVPVTVDHKWGQTTKVVAVPVKPAAGTGNGN